METGWKRWLARPLAVFGALLTIKLLITQLSIFRDFNIAHLVIEFLSVVAVAMLVELLVCKTAARRFFWLVSVNFILTAVLFSAIMYHKYYGVIVTYRALAQIGQVVHIRASVVNLTDPFYVLMFADILLAIALYFGNRRFRAWALSSAPISRHTAGAVLGVALLACYASVISNLHVINESKKAEKMGLINYEVYEILSVLKPDEDHTILVTPEEIRRLKGSPIKPEEHRAFYGAAEGRNLIVIQLESIQNFLIDLEIDGTPVMPNLSRLAKDHFYFSNMYQQIGQGNTSDSEFLVNTSLYIPPDGAASQKYGDRVLPGLPRLLKEQGYETMTFHTNDIVFWNRDLLYPALGFDRAYDVQFFGETDLVAFGASDEVLYAKTLQELKRVAAAGQPFYAMVISMSSHHPYFLPEKKIRMELPEPFKGTLVGRYLVAAHYADYALGQFIDGLKESGLWDNSLVVIYGDHFGLPINSLDKKDLELLQQLNGRAYDYAQMFNIPLVVAVPGETEGRTFGQVGGHVDLMPTICNLLGLRIDHVVHFGQDLLNHEHNLLPIRYYLPSGSFINDEVIFIPGEGFEDGVQILLVHASQGSRNRSMLRDQFERALRLLEYSDSYVGQLPEREH
jgi:phosphoglycerol transferase MdoB-like AlkP superfamily enzyme